MKGTVESIETISLALPGPASSDLRQHLQAFEGREYSTDVLSEILETVSNTARQFADTPQAVFRPVVSLHKGTSANGVIVRLNYHLQPAFVQTPFGPRAAPGTVETPFGTLIGVVGGVNRGPSPIAKVDPVYPPLARQAKVQGVVVMEATVNPDGSVANLRVVSGHPLLIQAAIEAAKQWRFEPQANTVTTMVNVNFAL
jgi:TonB family protein